MARKRRGQPIHGWVSIDKPTGRTSAQVTAQVRRVLDAAKAGHGGTLDPIATGVLPIALGEATKTVSYVMDGKKRYRFTVRWGEERTTDDLEGDVTNVSAERPSEAEIQSVLPEFIGVIEQVPPDYSAIKLDGKRAYDLARAGEEVSIAKREVYIEEFSLVSMPDEDHAVFEVASGKGTYMRSLARDIARRLGTVGHIAELRRTHCSPFSESASISLESLEALVHSAPPSAYLLAVETALDDIPALALTEDEARRLRSGQAISALQVAKRTPLNDIDQGATICAMADGKVVALAKFEGGESRPFRVLNL